MEVKSHFLASLSETQLGFYYAHEYDAELSELLKDELNVKQYQLYEKIKEHEQTVANQSGQQSTALINLSNMVKQMVVKMDSMETNFKLQTQALKMVEAEYKNLNELIKDELNVKQYQLYEMWKEHEISIANKNGQQSVTFMQLTDKINKMTEVVSARMNSIETKLDDLLNWKANGNDNDQQSFPLTGQTTDPRKLPEDMGMLSKSICSIMTNTEQETDNAKIDNIEPEMENDLKMKSVDCDDDQQSVALRDSKTDPHKLPEDMELLSRKSSIETQIEEGTNYARIDDNETEMENILTMFERSSSDNIVEVEHVVEDSEKAIIKKVDDTVQNVGFNDWIFETTRNHRCDQMIIHKARCALFTLPGGINMRLSCAKRM